MGMAPDDLSREVYSGHRAHRRGLVQFGPLVGHLDGRERMVEHRVVLRAKGPARGASTQRLAPG